MISTMYDIHTYIYIYVNYVSLVGLDSIELVGFYLNWLDSISIGCI